MCKSRKKSDRTRLVEKLDRIFSKYIRLRDKQCVVCGSTDRLQCGHLLSKMSYSTRWSEVNASTQCGHCNIVHNTNPGPYMLWFIDNHGKKELHKLTKEYSSHKKFSNKNIKELIDIYTEKVRRFKEGMA